MTRILHILWRTGILLTGGAAAIAIVVLMALGAATATILLSLQRSLARRAARSPAARRRPRATAAGRLPLVGRSETPA